MGDDDGQGRHVEHRHTVNPSTTPEPSIKPVLPRPQLLTRGSFVDEDTLLLGTRW